MKTPQPPMKRLLPAWTILLAACGASATPTTALDSPPSESDARRAVADFFTPVDERLRRVEVSAVPDAPGVFATLFDTEPRWFGTWACVGVARGRIDWIADFDGRTTPSQSRSADFGSPVSRSPSSK